MIIFAIQEMVELSPNNILNENNPKTNEWKKALDVEIQKLPTTFIFVDKIELVGMWMIVYIANKWKTSIKGVFKESVKTGMGGKYGNKGGVIIRIKID
jgi:phosphatidylinositol-bisphosphatase